MIDITEKLTVPKTPRRSAAEQVLIEYVNQISPLTDAEIDQILELIKVREHKKGKYLLRESQVGNVCYFVMQGCVRQFYLIDGDEKTTQFFTEGMPVSSTFVFDDKPPKFYLVCNEDCILIEGRAEDEQAFFEKMPQMEALSRMGAEIELQKSSEDFADFIISNPEGRYLKLLETRPELIDRVPQYQLASFLGVTPESLSRIRRRIMSK